MIPTITVNKIIITTPDEKPFESPDMYSSVAVQARTMDEYVALVELKKQCEKNSHRWLQDYRTENQEDEIVLRFITEQAVVGNFLTMLACTEDTRLARFHDLLYPRFLYASNLYIGQG